MDSPGTSERPVVARHTTSSFSVKYYTHTPCRCTQLSPHTQTHTHNTHTHSDTHTHTHTHIHTHTVTHTHTHTHIHTHTQHTHTHTHTHTHSHQYSAPYRWAARVGSHRTLENNVQSLPAGTYQSGGKTAERQSVFRVIIISHSNAQN